MALAVVSSGDVFWQDDNGTIWTGTEGTAPIQLTAQVGVAGKVLLIDRGSVYFALDGSLVRYDPSTQSTDAVLTGLIEPIGLAQDEDSIFVASLAAPVRAIAKDDLSQVGPIDATMGMDSVALAVDISEIYVSMGHDLVAVSKLDGSMRTVVPVANADELKVIGGRVYWLQYGAAVKSAATDGADVRVETMESPTAFTVIGTDVFWLSSDEMGTTAFGKSGEMIAVGQDYAHGLASRPGGPLYWIGGVLEGSVLGCAVMSYSP